MAGGMRFGYADAMRYLRAGDIGRRTGWPLSDVIRAEGDGFVRCEGGAKYRSTPDDRAATDWIVYRR